MWIHTHCDSDFHDIKYVDGVWIAVHGDGEVCTSVEFDVSDLVEG